jgi:hypothetical protein
MVDIILIMDILTITILTIATVMAGDMDIILIKIIHRVVILRDLVFQNIKMFNLSIIEMFNLSVIRTLDLSLIEMFNLLIIKMIDLSVIGMIRINEFRHKTNQRILEIIVHIHHHINNRI